MIKIKKIIEEDQDQSLQINKKLFLTVGNINFYWINGEWARKNLSIEYTIGGHHFRYDQIPDNEIWMERNNRSQADFKADCVHELTEFLVQKYKGLDYDDAHENWADKIEQFIRQDLILENKIKLYTMILRENFDHEYPVVYAGQTIDGLTVLKDIPNLSSISSSFNSDEYMVRKGIRKVPISSFNAKPTDLFYASNDIDHTHKLADQIKASGQIKPLIVVHDKEGLYVLEGAHRLGALYLIGVKYIPALIVDDLSSLQEGTRIISPDEKTIVDSKWVRPGDYLSHYKFGIGQILAIDLKSFSVPMVTFLPNNETDEKNAVYRSAHEFKQLSGPELRSLHNRK
jgi:disulfide oxidoreductase YuzD